MKKRLAWLLLVCMVCSFVFSAGASAESIVFAGWSGEEESTKDIFIQMREGFQTKTGTTVDWVGWPWADTAQQLLIRAQGNEQLDIAQVDITIFSNVSAAGILADWNDILGADFVSENFEAASLAIGQVDGKQYGLPWTIAAGTMVYNPQILAAAGWDAPPVTVEEFEKCLADVAASDPEVIPYAISTKDTTCANDFVPWLWTFGGTLFDGQGGVSINNEKAAACVEWYKGLLANNFIRMDMSRFDSRQLFAQGKVAFYDDAVVAKGVALGNGVALEDVTSVCSAMPRPVLVVGNDPLSQMWGHMLVIFDKSAAKDQAGEFAKYLLSEEVAIPYFEKNGLPPALKSLIESDQVQNDAYIKGFLDATKTARLEETVGMSNGNEIKTIIVEELQAALLDAKTVQEALDDAAARIAAAL